MVKYLKMNLSSKEMEALQNNFYILMNDIFKDDIKIIERVHFIMNDIK